MPGVRQCAVFVVVLDDPASQAIVTELGNGVRTVLQCDQSIPRVPCGVKRGGQALGLRERGHISIIVVSGRWPIGAHRFCDVCDFIGGILRAGLVENSGDTLQEVGPVAGLIERPLLDGANDDVEARLGRIAKF